MLIATTVELNVYRLIQTEFIKYINEPILTKILSQFNLKNDLIVDNINKTIINEIENINNKILKSEIKYNDLPIITFKKILKNKLEEYNIINYKIDILHIENLLKATKMN